MIIIPRYLSIQICRESDAAYCDAAYCVGNTNNYHNYHIITKNNYHTQPAKLAANSNQNDVSTIKSSLITIEDTNSDICATKTILSI